MERRSLYHGAMRQEVAVPLDQNPNIAPAGPLWAMDVETIAEPNAAEMLRLAEIRHEATFRAALGMDQRASVLAAGFAAAAGALIAASAAIQSPAWMKATLFVAIGLGVAAALSAYACRPQRSQFPGMMPIVWATTPAWFNEPKRDLAIALAADLQDRMAEAERKQAANGRCLLAAMLIAAACPLVAASLTFVL